MISELDVHTLGEVRSLIERHLATSLSAFAGCVEPGRLAPGKMLRSRLALTVYHGVRPAVDFAIVADICAATELVHTASLCHDDVIDQALLRRRHDTLWKAVGVSGAILVGDLLLCEAIRLILAGPAQPYVTQFVDKVHEVVAAETEQELLRRGGPADRDVCVRLARGKTGPLFAMPALACGGDNSAMVAALEETGYLIGTAYQLADDLQDVVGDEQTAGKTLGTDEVRGKFTLPRTVRDGRGITRDHIRRLCGSALEQLLDWPEARDAVARYLAADLEPVLRRFDETLSMKDLT